MIPDLLMDQMVSITVFRCFLRVSSSVGVELAGEEAFTA
jgi:hypothetical protein